MSNTRIFETMLSINKEYVDALNNNDSALVQESLLKQSQSFLKSSIINAGLSKEYREYCESKIAKNGKLF